RDRKKRDVRLRIAHAAWQLTVEHGFAQVRTEDIAAAADVSARTFDHYFPSKEAAEQAAPSAVLVRPDGHVGWTGIDGGCRRVR
ncbi:MAG: TetR family transcriptional regulator, partial [Microlunatus sp.]|nr:TetR family transcriptional regulator [Microlunatus sp.]